MRCWGAIALIAGCGGAPAGDDVDGADAGTTSADARTPSSIDAADPTSDGGGPPIDPASPGSWDIHAVDDTASTGLGEAGVTIYSPSSDGGVTPAAGPFPLVVVSTGFQIGRDSYQETCRHLASWGYLVVAHDYTSGNHQEKAAEIGDLIDWALDELGGRADGSRIAVAGHSLGGKVSIQAAILDSRIDAVIGWDPVDALPPFSDGSTSVTPEQMAGLTVPLAVLGELTDAGGGGGMACAPAADNYARYFEAACAAPAALEVTIDGADHTDWVDDRGRCGLACAFCGRGAIADAIVREITRRVTTAWLELHLRGIDAHAPYLVAPGDSTRVRSDVPGC